LTFFASSLENLLSKIPAIEDQSGIKFQIKIKIQNFSTVLILISLVDKTNNPICLQNLEENQIEYFLNQYRKYVESGSYDKSESVMGRFQSALQTAGALLKNKQVSNFYLSMNYSLPWSFLDKFYTIDKYNNSCIAKTVTNEGTMINIMDRNSGRLIPLFHTLSLKMIYDLYLNENKRQIHIFEKMTKYLRMIIPTAISILFINDLIQTLSNPLNPSQIYFYIILLGMSFFPNVIFRIIITIFIKRNIWKSNIEKKIKYFKDAFGNLQNK
jgi:hypothetical protein